MMLRIGLFLLFLFSMNVSAGIVSTAVDQGSDWLLEQQNSDGSWGDDATKFVVTSAAVNALRKTANWNSAYFRGVTWLENHASKNVDFSARRIEALTTHGDDLIVSFNFLADNQDATSSIDTLGWGLSKSYRGSNLDTALALLAHSYSALPTPIDVNGAIAFLVSQQSVTGGWSHGLDNTDDALTTAFALRALSRLGNTAFQKNNAIAQLTTLIADADDLVSAYAVLSLIEAGANSGALVDSIAINVGSWASENSDVHTAAISLQVLGESLGYTDPTKTRAISFTDNAVRTSVAGALSRNVQDAIRVVEAESFDGSLTLNNANNLDGVENFTRLTTLDVNGRTITDFSNIQALSNLRSLDLSNTGITLTQAQAIIPSLTRLEFLDLSGLDFSNVSEIDFLASLPNLDHVVLSSSNFLFGNCFSFFGPVTRVDTDGDGIDDCDEYTVQTNLFNANSFPNFFPVDETADLNPVYSQLSGTGGLTGGWHPLWSDFDHDGDKDIAIYIHGKDEVNSSEELSCSFDCDVGYTGRINGEFVIFENNNGNYIQKAIVGSQELPEDIRDYYVYDYNNDGLEDIFIRTLNKISLFKNNGNMNFSNVSDEVFESLAGTIHSFNKTLIMDANSDGYLDVLGIGGNSSILFEYDEALAKYIEVTDPLEFGFANAIFKTNIASLDVNNDSNMDVVFYNTNFQDPLPSKIYLGDGDGSFTLHEELGTPRPRSLDVINLSADINNDGLMDILAIEERRQDAGNRRLDYGGTNVRPLINTSNVFNGLYSFSETTNIEGLEHPSLPSQTLVFPRGGNAFDADNDGDLDVLIAEAGRSSLGGFFRQESPGLFQRITSGPEIIFAGNNLNPVLADMDSDGDLDVLPASGGNSIATPIISFYENKNRSGNNGITIRLIGDHLREFNGRKSTRNAYGARLEIIAAGDSQTKQHIPAFGDDNTVHFGIGTATSADITVHWPSGRVETYSNIQPGFTTFDETQLP